MQNNANIFIPIHAWKRPLHGMPRGLSIWAPRARIHACANTQTLAHAHADTRVANVVVAIILVIVASATAATNARPVSAGRNPGARLHGAKHVTAHRGVRRPGKL